MHKGNWEIISKQIEEADKEIFKGIDKSTLSDYEKRKMIFDYLVNNLEYDEDRLLDIILASNGYTLKLKKGIISKEVAKREIFDHMMKNQMFDKNIYQRIVYKIDNDLLKPINTTQDLENVMKTKKCLCHSGSQFYKLLLEYNGIYAACVFCDNNMPVPHQLTLIYDKESNSYSFDDISTAAAAKNSEGFNIEWCFDYDYEGAKKLNQGSKPIYQDEMGKDINWFINSSVLVNAVAGRDDDWYLNFGLEQNDNIYLPDNIRSLKDSVTKK